MLVLHAVMDFNRVILFNARQWKLGSTGAWSRISPRPVAATPREASKPMSTIEDRVKKIVVEQLGVGEDQVTPDASFVDDLGADSLDTVELVMALEEEFDTEIPDDEAEKITTVKQAIEFVQANITG